jgi:hypothetical protein
MRDNVLGDFHPCAATEGFSSKTATPQWSPAGASGASAKKMAAGFPCGLSLGRKRPKKGQIQKSKKQARKTFRSVKRLDIRKVLERRARATRTSPSGSSRPRRRPSPGRRTNRPCLFRAFRAVLWSTCGQRQGGCRRLDVPYRNKKVSKTRYAWLSPDGAHRRGLNCQIRDPFACSNDSAHLHKLQPISGCW